MTLTENSYYGKSERQATKDNQVDVCYFAFFFKKKR